MAGRKRLDPVARPADGRKNYDYVAGKDPNRHYVLANPNDDATGLASYLDRGYAVETVRTGGPATPTTKDAAPGAKVTRGGLVLVSRPMEDHRLEEAEGQELASAFERRILRDGGVEDGLRGRGFQIGFTRDSYAGEEA